MNPDPTCWAIPLSRPEVSEETVAGFVELLRSPFLSAGPHLDAFERLFAGYTGSPHALGVSSGTAGLHLAVRILGLGPGAEVVTSPFSFIASANCMLYEDATPVFADVDPDTFLLDADAAAAAISPRTRCLLVVHVFGNAADMDRFGALAARHRLAVIEDACEAVGGSFRGRKLGTFGEFGVFGFYPNKQMTTGEGGMVLTPRADFARRVSSLRNQGRSPSGDGSFAELGFNYRLSELGACLGERQLGELDAFLERRRGVLRRYEELLAGIDEVRVPALATSGSPFVFLIQAAEGTLRDHLRERLAHAGIQSAVYFRPIHLERFYRERFALREGQFPVAEHAGRTCLALPFFNRLAEADQARVAAAVREATARWLEQRSVAGVAR